MQLRGLVQADGRLCKFFQAPSILSLRLDWRSSPPFLLSFPWLASGSDLHLRMATKSRRLEEAVRCRARVPQVLVKAEKGKQRGRCFHPEPHASLQSFAWVPGEGEGDGSTGSVAKDDQGFGYVSVPAVPYFELHLLSSFQGGTHRRDQLFCVQNFSAQSAKGREVTRH